MSAESLSTRNAISERQSWPDHVRATLTLGLPLIGTHLAQLAITATDAVMIGWLGAIPLGASVLAGQSFFLLLMLGSGFAQAIMPIAAQAGGRGDIRGVRRSVRMGLWITSIYCALSLPPLWFLEPLLLAAGQDETVSALAGDYMAIMMWSFFPAMLSFVLRSFLIAVSRPQIMLWTAVVAAIMNGLLNYALIFGNWGAPELGIEGAAYASAITSTFSFAFLCLYAAIERRLSRFGIFVRLWRPDWPAFLEVLRLGWPIGLTIIAEAGLFTASSVMMGWLGTVELAAHGIALQLASIAFMIPLGLSGVATVRVGQAFGREDFAGLLRAAQTVLGLSVFSGIVSAALFLATPRPLASLFLDLANPDAARVLASAVSLLAFAAAFQLFDCVQAVAAGLLRGLKDTRTPMIIAVFSYWVIGMPGACILAFGAGIGGAGVWLGLAIGLAAAAVLLTFRFFRMAPAAG